MDTPAKIKKIVFNFMTLSEKHACRMFWGSKNIVFKRCSPTQSTEGTRCELVRDGLTTRAKPPQGASARTRGGRSARWYNPTNIPPKTEILMKSVAYN